MKPDHTRWEFVVRPENTTRVVITQRHDIDHFYVGVEDLHLSRRRWEHREGSAKGGFGSYTEAERIACDVIENEKNIKRGA